MPNLTGGKNYKKSKHASGIEKPFYERQEDQQYGRILRNLGGRNMLVYCNDNKIRLCHICGGMKKSSWLSVGDLILVSLRDFEKKVEPGTRDRYEKGDILYKYDSEHYGKLKKVKDINPKLFMQLETMDGTVLAAIGEKEMEKKEKGIQEEEETGGIEFDRGDEEDEEEKSESEDKPRGDKSNKPVKTSKAAAATQKDKEDAEDDNFNIDEI